MERKVVFSQPLGGAPPGETPGPRAESPGRPPVKPEGLHSGVGAGVAPSAVPGPASCPEARARDVIGLQFERTGNDEVSLFVEFIVCGRPDYLPPEGLRGLLLRCPEYNASCLGAPLLGWAAAGRKQWISHSYKRFTLGLGWYGANLRRLQAAISAQEGSYQYVRPLGSAVRRLRAVDLSPSGAEFTACRSDLGPAQKHCAAQLLQGVLQGAPVLLRVRPSLERNEAVLEALRVLRRPAVIVTDEACVGQWMSQAVRYYNAAALGAGRGGETGEIAKTGASSAGEGPGGLRGPSKRSPAASPAASAAARCRLAALPPCLRPLAARGAFPYRGFGYRKAARRAFDPLHYCATADGWVLPLAYSDLQEGSPFQREYVRQLTSGFSPLAREKLLFVVTPREFGEMVDRGLVRRPDTVVVYDQPSERWWRERVGPGARGGPGAGVGAGVGAASVVLLYAPLSRSAPQNAWLHALLWPPGEALDLRRYSGASLGFQPQKASLEAPDPDYDAPALGSRRAGPARRGALPIYESEYEWVIRRQEVRLEAGGLGVRGDWVERCVVRLGGGEGEARGGPREPQEPQEPQKPQDEASEESGGSEGSDGARPRVRGESPAAPRAPDSRAFLDAAYDFVLRYVRKARHGVVVACRSRATAERFADISPGRTVDLFRLKTSAECRSVLAETAEAQGAGESPCVGEYVPYVPGLPSPPEARALVLLDLRSSPAGLNLGWAGTAIVVQDGPAPGLASDALAAQAAICHGLRGSRGAETGGRGDPPGAAGGGHPPPGPGSQTTRPRRRLIILSQEPGPAPRLQPAGPEAEFPQPDRELLEALPVRGAPECLEAWFGRE